jgi:hypothetical protein
MNNFMLIICGSLLLIGISFNSAGQQQEDWRVALNIPGTGNLETVMNFEFEDSTFQAYSKGEQAQSIVGFWKYTMSRIFSDKFKSGSITYIKDVSLQQKGEDKILKGVLNTPLGNRYWRGRMASGTLKGYLLNGKKDTVGKISGSRFQEQLPLRDYKALSQNALDTIQQYLYDPDELKSDAWEDFQAGLKETSAKLKDDLGMLLSFAYLSRDLPFSHLGLTRKISAGASNMAGRSSSPDLVRLNALSDSTIKMTIYSFGGSAKGVNEAFQKVKNQGYQNLIVDLRFNSGGGIEAGMAFINQLIHKQRPGGVFLTRSYFRNHDTLPSPSAYQQFPTLDEDNYEAFMTGIHRYSGISLKIDPVKNPYRGDVYVLTSSRTASTCEPLVYALKQHDRAEIVGQKTAGSMLSVETFSLPHNYKVFVPTSSYYTADGYEIDQQGVKPDHEVSYKKALQYTQEKLIGNVKN